MTTHPADLPAFLNTHYAGAPFQVVSTFETKGQRKAYHVRSSAGQYVVKISDPDRPESTLYSDTRTQAYLSNLGFPAPRPVPSLAGLLYLDFSAASQAARRFIYLYEYIPGAAPRAEAAFYRRLGTTLARLHSLPWEGLVPLSAYRPAAELALLRARLLTVSAPAQQSAVDDLLGLIERFPAFDELPTGIIHSDPYFVNLLETPWGAIYLIDWDDAGVSYPLLDVGYVLAHLCSFTPRDRGLWGVPGAAEGLSVRPDWARLFLSAYQSIRPLTAAEHRRLADAVRFSFLVYSLDGETNTLIMENYQRMKMVEAALDLTLG